MDRKVLEKTGAWYSYKNERLGQGREQVREFLKSNPAIAREVETRLRDLAGAAVRQAEKRADGREPRLEDKRPDGRDDKRAHVGRSA